jgi:VWFA-related protein
MNFRYALSSDMLNAGKLRVRCSSPRVAAITPSLQHPSPGAVYIGMRLSLPPRTTLNAAAALLVLPFALFAQQPASATKPVTTVDPATGAVTQPPASSTPQAATLSVDSRLVNIPVVVRDTKGALVQNLTKTDFTLKVDDKPATIRYFDLDNNLPLTLGLLVDTSESQRSVIDDERSASSAFLDQMLTGKQDQAFVIQFARSVELLQDLTASRPKLQAALKDLDTPNPNDQSNGSDPDSSGSGSGSSRRARGGTTLYDSVFLSADELLSKQKGRKAIVVLTDGDDRGSKERLTDAIEAAQRADTIIYAIYFKGEQPHQDYNNGGNRGGRSGGIGFPGGGYPGGGGGYPGGGRGGNNPNRMPEQHNDGKKILERMARETGGRMFEVSKKQPVADIFTEIAKELRAQYRLGYTPDPAAAADGYHQIELTLTSPDRKKFTVQTRDGYYVGK